VSEDGLTVSRRRFEARWADLQAALESELGWAPRASRWVLLLAAAAAGFALGGGLGSRLLRRRLRR
jgi:hypothetical protein